MAAALCPLLGFSQLGVTNLGETYSIDFDNAVTGVNTGTFLGAGFISGGGSNKLDSRAFKYSGATSPASVAFGGTADTDQASRGSSNGFNGTMNGGNIASQVGFYAFNTNNTGISNPDYCLGWFTSSLVSPAVLRPGVVTLKIDNNSGQTINVIRLAYEAKELNRFNASTNINVTYSFSEFGTYTTFGTGFDHTTAAGQDAYPQQWSSNGKSVVLTGLNWASAGSLYIRFTTNDASGSGSFDPVGIDDISIRAYSADYVHNGTWSPSAPTGALTTSDVLILPNLSGTPAQIWGSTTLKNLYIEAGAKVDVPDTSDLTLDPSGKLYLYADGNGYAQIRGEVYGVTAVYQTHRLASSGRWFNMAIPVEATYDDVAGIFIQTVANPANTNLWKYNAALPVTNTADGTWEHVTDKTTAQTEEAAYQLYGGDGTYFGSGPFDLEVEGPLVDSDVSFPVTGKSVGTGRFNLVPNPFASGLDWEGVKIDNNTEMGPTYYIQDGDPNLGTVQYRSYTFGSGKVNNLHILAPGQAFFVTINNTTDGFIDINRARQNVDNEIDLYKTTAVPGLVGFGVNHLTLGYSDKVEMKFDSQYNDQFVFQNDGVKRMNIGYPNIYTKSSDNQELVFNALSDAWTTKDVVLYFQGDEAGNYHLNMNYDGLPAEWTVILEDKMLGNFINVRKSGYGFTHATGASADRFVVHFNKTGAVGLDELNGAVVFSYVKNQTLAVNLDVVNNAEVTVFDMNGKQVAKATNQNGIVEFDMTDWAKGVYMINVSSNGKQVHSNKVVH